jgi:predicted dehydrogenase
VTVRIGIVGCGAIARRAHAPAFKASDGASLTAWASRTRASAEAAAAESGEGTVYDEWRELVERDDVDAVDICSPNAFHREQAVAAAKAGKHVLVEKPIACTPDEADEMLSAAEDAGVVLQVAHNLRYLPAILAARDVVADGRLGGIVGLRAAFGHSGPKASWASDATWFFDRALSGGGALIDLGIHIIDVVNFVTRLEAKEVTAMTSGTGECEDAAQLALAFGNGAIGSIHASWVARPAPDMSLTIFGEEGTLHFDTRSPLTWRPADGKKEQIELPDVTANPFDDFVRVVAGDAPAGPAAPGAEARDAIAIVSAAYESASSGKTVEVA